MVEDYSKLLKRLDYEASWGHKLPDEAATAIRALVAENERYREVLGVLTACASSDDAFGLEDALSNARAALGEAK